MCSAEQLIPAGSLIQCTVAEPKLSSKTAEIGDPVLCQVSHVELYGRSVFPYGSYLVGRFEDYKDPGHLVGKGWMELKFDRLVVGNDTIVPVAAKVVSVPKYQVDRQGRILGNGHPVRDVVEWMIPVLWPIDLINLPRRGPRVVLKPETRLTLKIMDDFGVPTREEMQPRQPALVSRIAPEPVQQQPAPIVQAYAPQPAPTTVIVQQQPAPIVYQYVPQPVAVPVPVRYYPPPPPPMYGYPVYRAGYYGPY
jgi:hypothetical protein